ncbi:twitching motility protein PilT [Kaistia sp. 32K]|uniref:type II toxin-antitoxin system VapC family toxin n=1 Tax=Kaistia sp. 32K TaxID=2795690 RepID=UPI00191673E5|nr:type II toxin-antitoxin system VapC family toxin [Kaistia sp. 32K]BCP52580.1 twitching motility protein PilT [Kaistia sp. 32K]
MRLLLDTHVWLWWMMGSARLAPPARAAIADPANEPLVSAASILELLEKARAGILPGLQRLTADIESEIDEERFGRLPITTEHAARAETLAGAHDDLFDRLLIAQALIENVELVSSERRFDAFGVRRLWEG